MKFLLIFVILLGTVTLFSIGVIFKRKPIKGSCGGLGILGIEKACDCKTPCNEELENNTKQTHNSIKEL